MVWSLAAGVAIGALTVRWVARSPARATLDAGRIAGLGAAALVAAAALVVLPPPGANPRTALAGGLFAGGVAALLGLPPVGGWAAATAAAVRGIDLAPWALLVVPSLLLSTGALLGNLPDGAHTALADVLLGVGLAGALYGTLRAAAASGRLRYGRVLLVDIALAAAALGSGHDPGGGGVLLLVLTHLCVGPLLLHETRPGTDRPARLAWLALSGLPPSPAFWGRLLILEGLAGTSGWGLLLGVLAGIGVLVASIRALLEPAPPVDLPAAAFAVRVLAWAVAVAAIAVGMAPGGIAGRIFGAPVLG